MELGEGFKSFLLKLQLTQTKNSKLPPALLFEVVLVPIVIKNKA